MSRHDRDGLWPAVAAAALTCASFAGMLHSLGETSSWVTLDARAARHAAPERVTLVMLRDVPTTIAASSAAPALRSVRPTAPVAPSMESSTKSAAHDSGAAQPTSTAATPDPEGHPSSLSPYYSSPRLVPSRQLGTPWYSLPRRRAPLAPAEALSVAEQDSTVRAMGAEVPWLAAQRIQTQSERDAASKEAMLKIHLSGRSLLVPPDNTGGMITASIPLPLFGAGPSRARRRRESRVDDENRARLERLKQRADSLKRARGDSLPPT